MTHGPRHRLNLDRERGHQQQLLDGLLPRRRMELGFQANKSYIEASLPALAGRLLVCDELLGGKCQFLHIPAVS